MAEKQEPQDALQEAIEAVAAEPDPPENTEEGSDDTLDADALELREALKAAEEAEQAPAEEPAPGTEASTQPPAEPGNSPPGPQQRQVPLGALHAEREARRKLELELAHLQGRLDATTAKPEAPQAPDPTPQERIDALESKWDDDLQALATRYEDGEIDFATHQREASKINRSYMRKSRELDVRPEAPAPDPQAVLREINDDASVLRVTETLNRDNPWLVQPTPRLQQALVAELGELQGRAHEWAQHLAEQAGRPFGGLGPKGQTAFLRIGMVAAAREAGIDQVYSRTLPPAPQPAAPAAAAPKSGAPTVDQRRAKVSIAKSHPPDLTQAGQAGSHEAVTEDQILQMTDEEIMALPLALRRRLTGT